MYRSWLIATSLLATLATASGQTSAQDAPTAGQPDPARLTLARTLVQTMRAEEQARASLAHPETDAADTFDRLVPVQTAMRYQLANPQGFDKIRAQAVKLIADDRREMAGEMLPLLVDAQVRRYAKHFSVAELRAINAFYASPTGQRLIAEQPAMSADDKQFQASVVKAVLSAHSAAVGPKLLVVLAPMLRSTSASTTTGGKTP